MSRIREHIPEQSPASAAGKTPDRRVPRTATLQIADDLDLLLEILPERIKQALTKADGASDLIEVVMDLGRLPEARFSDKEALRY